MKVEPDSIWVRDGDVYSSAGVVAGIDLGLALVEEDLGADIARQVAQSLLVYLQRAGGQSQFSASLGGPTPTSAAVREVVELIRADPSRPYSVAELAAVANVSPRSLTRMFRSELQASPAEYLAFARFGFARDKLDAGWTSPTPRALPVMAVLSRCAERSSIAWASHRASTSSVSARPSDRSQPRPAPPGPARPGPARPAGGWPDLWHTCPPARGAPDRDVARLGDAAATGSSARRRRRKLSFRAASRSAGRARDRPRLRTERSWTT